VEHPGQQLLHTWARRKEGGPHLGHTECEGTQAGAIATHEDQGLHGDCSSRGEHTAQVVREVGGP
jgi:hypothetical protein